MKSKRVEPFNYNFVVSGDIIAKVELDDPSYNYRCAETECFRKSESYYIIKRIIDIIGSLLGLILMSPFMLITAAAVKLTSDGPVFLFGKGWGKRKIIQNVQVREHG